MTDTIRAADLARELVARAPRTYGFTLDVSSLAVLLVAAEAIDPPTVKRLSDTLDLTISQCSEAVSRLEKGGFVERKRDRRDHRNYLIALTPKGQQTMRRTREKRRAGCISSTSTEP